MDATAHLRLLRRVAFACALAAGTPFLAPAAAQADSSLGVCRSSNLLTLSEGAGGESSPCAVGVGRFLIQTSYFQNASKVGGSALAAYPMFRVRAGLSGALDVIIDTPSQTAYSGAGGVGLYPFSHAGAGLQYRFEQTSRFVSALDASIDAPGSRYEPVPSQPRYSLGVTSKYRIDDRWAIDTSAAGQTSERVGFERVTPRASVGFTFSPNARTQVSSSISARLMVRRGALQRYGDIAVTELLSRKVAFNVGLGSAFNPVGNTKGHYLNSGFSFRP